MKVKMVVITVVVTAGIAGGVGYAAYYAMQGQSTPVDVVPVRNVNQTYWGSSSNSLSGTVTSQVAQTVSLEDEYEIEEIYVKQGDTVKVGDPLFSYDMTLPELELEMEQLTLQTLEIEKTKIEKEIDKLQKTTPTASLETHDLTMTASGEGISEVSDTLAAVDASASDDSGDAILDDVLVGAGSSDDSNQTPAQDTSSTVQNQGLTLEGIEEVTDPEYAEADEDTGGDTSGDTTEDGKENSSDETTGEEGETPSDETAGEEGETLSDETAGEEGETPSDETAGEEGETPSGDTADAEDDTVLAGLLTQYLSMMQELSGIYQSQEADITSAENCAKIEQALELRGKIADYQKNGTCRIQEKVQTLVEGESFPVTQDAVQEALDQLTVYHMQLTETLIGELAQIKISDDSYEEQVTYASGIYQLLSETDRQQVKNAQVLDAAEKRMEEKEALGIAVNSYEALLLGLNQLVREHSDSIVYTDIESQIRTAYDFYQKEIADDQTSDDYLVGAVFAEYLGDEASEELVPYIGMMVRYQKMYIDLLAKEVQSQISGHSETKATSAELITMISKATSAYRSWFADEQSDGTYRMREAVGTLLGEKESSALEAEYVELLIDELDVVLSDLREKTEQVRAEYENLSSESQSQVGKDSVEKLEYIENLLEDETESETQTEQPTETATDTEQPTETTTDTEQSTELTTDTEQSTEAVTDTEQSTETITDTELTTEPTTDSEQSTEPATDSEQSTEPTTDSEQSTEPATDSEQSTEPATDTEQPTEAPTESITDSEQPTEAATEPATESEQPTEAATEPISETQTEPITGAESESETESESESESESETESDTTVEPVTEPETEQQTESREDIRSYIQQFLTLAASMETDENYLDDWRAAIEIFQQHLGELAAEVAGSEKNTMDQYQLRADLAESSDFITDGLEDLYHALCVKYVNALISRVDPMSLDPTQPEKYAEAYAAYTEAKAACEELGENWASELQEKYILDACETILLIQAVDETAEKEEIIAALITARDSYSVLSDEAKMYVWNYEVLAELMKKYGVEFETEPETEFPEESENWDDWGDYSDWGDWDDWGDTGESYTAAELKEMIEEKEDELKECELDIREQKLAVNQKQRIVDGKIVKSTLNGTVMSIGSEDGSSDEDYFVKVASAEGLYAKGAMNELSLADIQVGDTISGMTDMGDSFTAVIQEISTYPDASGSYYSYGSDNSNASYYQFLALIDDPEGLEEGSAELQLSETMTDYSDSIFLENYFIRTDSNDKTYVMKQGEDGLLTKQYVTTGITVWGYMTEVKDGITLDDKIAFPYGSTVVEGAKTEEVDQLDYE